MAERRKDQKPASQNVSSSEQKYHEGGAGRDVGPIDSADDSSARGEENRQQAQPDPLDSLSLSHDDLDAQTNGRRLIPIKSDQAVDDRER